MSKLLTTTITALFVLGSTAASAEYRVKLEPTSAQEILNAIACKDKKPSEQIKDRTNGKMTTCQEPMKAGKDRGSTEAETPRPQY